MTFRMSWEIGQHTMVYSPANQEERTELLDLSYLYP